MFIIKEAMGAQNNRDSFDTVVPCALSKRWRLWHVFDTCDWQVINRVRPTNRARKVLILK